ncbi:Multidrug efflux pump subunit AcrA (membrane-fusion protein) [Ruminococcus sp. YE71]|uniref:HlyD family efflux transporter periplasmic adaptor subunit n=1 Tax=unclassified Ruminococcus TaxID=2608920 RepID=UPI000883FEA0|nr:MULTISPECIES: efflux RND transporter periplasmic adaptor subunit [unclassified Ruminococcus]SDA09548.1 Multidrug efflux pump subunit AcrA (membrane-fusion protein) [Ruminococcus sp. YE78]SFW12009.1 Multidrug efflux pump subunit AcrA (membrane-fusion protein) [Ruminococcus sp. YE71]
MKDKQKTKKKGRKLPWVIGGVVILAGGGIAVSKMVSGAKTAALEAMTGTQTAVVEKRDLKDTVAVSGIVKSKNTSNLTSDVVGNEFSEIKVEVGDKVKKGDIIAVLNSEELQKNLEAAQKSLENTKTKNEIELENAEEGYESAVSSKSTVSGRTARSVDEAQEVYNEAVTKDNQVYNKYLAAYNQRVACAAAVDSMSTMVSDASAAVKTLTAESDAANTALKTAKDAYDQLIADGKPEDSEEVTAAKTAYDNASAEAAKAAASLKEAKDSYTEVSAEYKELNDSLAEAYTSELELQSQLELANAEVKAAASALVAAKEGKSDSDKELDHAVKSGEDNLTTTKIMIDESLTVPQSEIDKLTDSIAQCVIIADMDGVVTELNYKAGQKYDGGTIAVIQDDTEFKVTSSVDQYDINRLTKDLSTDITVNAVSKDSFDGKLSFIAPTPEVHYDATSNTQTSSTDYDIEVTFDEPVDGLRIGMSAKLVINIEVRKDVLSVPSACVTKTADGHCSVEVQKDDGTTEKIDVQTGMENSYYIEIISDKIKEGMTVVLPTADSGDDDMFY